MQLVTRPPRDQRLCGLVRSIWHCRAPGASGRERMFPSGEMQLIVNLRADALRFAANLADAYTVRSGVLIQGMQSRAVVLDRSDQRDVMGVVFEPGVGRVLLGTPLDALTDDHVELSEMDLHGMSLREQLLQPEVPGERFDRMERWLVRNIRGEVDTMVQAALRLMRGGEQRVAVLASSIGTSERSLRRRFRAEVGLAPKQMSRQLRLQRAVNGLRGSGSLVDVALSSGYHDQAHLTHEFRALAGMSPSAYRRRSPVFRNHVD